MFRKSSLDWPAALDETVSEVRTQVRARFDSSNGSQRKLDLNLNWVGDQHQLLVTIKQCECSDTTKKKAVAAPLPQVYNDVLPKQNHLN